MQFRLVGEPRSVESMASGQGIRELDRLRKQFGGRNWRKLKGLARVELPSGRIREAEIHWYECHGIGRKLVKVKRLID